MQNTDNIRIKTLYPLISPSLLAAEFPITEPASNTVTHARKQINKILIGHDHRLIAVVGPCSIHDPNAALEYAKQLKPIAEQYQSELLIIMRVYFEKPRTTVGWKGIINDPTLDGSFNINQGLRIARNLLIEINQLGIPTGSEFLDTIIPQYISDLTSWAAIGARTTESQVHRELASGLSMPVGFKNGTGGSIEIAVDAVYAAAHPHHFLGISKQGVAAIVSTAGNSHCHVILRGSKHGPNYDRESISQAIQFLNKKNLPPRLMIDCSHGNSNKNYLNQPLVAHSLAEQISNGSPHIFGIMLESNLVAGNQELSINKPLVYGQSITDACIDLTQTKQVLDMLAQANRQRHKVGSIDEK